MFQFLAKLMTRFFSHLKDRWRLRRFVVSRRKRVVKEALVLEKAMGWFSVISWKNLHRTSKSRQSSLFRKDLNAREFLMTDRHVIAISLVSEKLVVDLPAMQNEKGNFINISWSSSIQIYVNTRSSIMMREEWRLSPFLSSRRAKIPFFLQFVKLRFRKLTNFGLKFIQFHPKKSKKMRWNYAELWDIRSVIAVNSEIIRVLTHNKNFIDIADTCILSHLIQTFDYRLIFS